MATTKFGLNQLKFNKGSKIYAKGDKADFAYYVHIGKLIYILLVGCCLAKLEREKFLVKEVPFFDESRSITAEAATNCVLYPISEKTLKEKIKSADPVLRAILRSLLIRLNDINVKSEDFWRNLNVMTSLTDDWI